MSVEQIEWPCGCRAVPGISDPPGVAFTQRQLVRCPLHGAAGELRDVVARLIAWSKCCESYDHRTPISEKLIDDALIAFANTVTKPEAKEAVSMEITNEV